MINSRLTALLVCMTITTGCEQNQKNEIEHSGGLKQLIANDFPCAADDSRLEAIRQNYSSALRGGNSQQKSDALDALSLIPKEYLMWVLDRNNVPVELRQTGGSVRGVTTSRNSGNGWHPSHIWVAPKVGNFNALLHEMGHATEHYLKYTYRGFRSDLTASYRQVMNSPEARLMRGYARSNETEYFAEVFDSFYCSEESRQYMAEKLPLSLEFARKYLVDPETLDTGNSGDNTQVGQADQVDDDQDMVSNHYDRCPDTPVGDLVMTSGRRYGCSDSQVATEDADNDGVADHKDRCPGTPAGARVWTDETGPNARWLGCAEGQTPSGN